MRLRIWRTRARRRLYRLMRAARVVQQSADPFGHLRIAGELERTSLDVPARAFKRLAPDGLRDSALVCLQQRLTEDVVYLNRELLPPLNLHLSQPWKPVHIGLPATWRWRLRVLGVPCSGVRSWIRWMIVLAKFCKRGVRSMLGLLRVCWAGELPRAPAVPYAVLMHLSPSNLPCRPWGSESHDFVTWYRRSPLGERMATVWAHVPNVGRAADRDGVVITPYFFPRLDTLAARARMTVTLLGIAVATLVRWVAKGAWWEVVLFDQLLHCAYAQRLGKEAFAKAYVFHNASFGHRPLWTYVAENHGSTIDLVFYATNIETFGVWPAQPRPYWPGYRTMTWSRYGVWDSYQAEFIRDLGHTRAPVIVLGAVGFTEGASLQPLPSPYVAVFDVTPQRIALHALRGIPQPYYTDGVWMRFLEDVAEALVSTRLALVYKNKREIGKVSAARYRARLLPLLAKVGGVAVPPDVASQHLIVNASAVISMPFTSTALIARSLGKPSVYYDPIGVLVGEARLAHGVRVIGTKAELVDWLGAVRSRPRVVAADGHEVAATALSVRE